MNAISGTHVLIDGYVRDGSLLMPGNLCLLFDQLVEELGMQYLQRPTAIRVAMDDAKIDGDQDDGGWSVFCQITTSHIALHGWPLRGAFMMDVFSCRDFNTQMAVELVVKFLRVISLNAQTIRRVDPRSVKRDLA